jgi:signal peptidase I
MLVLIDAQIGVRNEEFAYEAVARISGLCAVRYLDGYLPQRIGRLERGSDGFYEADTRLVKRVIGLPGDIVEMQDNRLRINGVEARYSNVEYTADAIFAIESYAGMTHRIELAPTGVSYFSSFGPVKVPQGHYLVLGDNRDSSADSRVRGFIPREEIVGDARTVVLSVNYDHYYLPRTDRFFRDL